MTVLQELARLYERLRAEGKAPPPGYSREKIGGEVVLDAEGNVLAINRLGRAENGKWQPRIEAVPSPPANRRGTKVVAGTLWDPAPYCLGIERDKDTADAKVTETTHEKFQAFKEHHERLLANTSDEGLRAILNFVCSWQPEMFVERGFDPELLNVNLVFRLEGDEVDGRRRFIHQRPAAEQIEGREETSQTGRCLVTGKEAPIARLHPAIKFLDPKAQSSGAYLVSFNIGSKKPLGASSSFGKVQGENAPVSEKAAFAYGTALNALLAKGSGRNLRIGDATVVFWAETPERENAGTIEEMLMGALNPPDEAAEANRLAALLHDVAKGRAPDRPEFAPDTRVFILGLAPNTARLAIRFWRPGTLGDFARNVLRFWEDLAQDPPAWDRPPAAFRVLKETVVKHWNERRKAWDYETYPNTKIPAVRPRLGGDLMQAVLTGAPYPRTLLSATIARIRADHDINARRVALIAAVLRRNFKEDVPMSLDRTNPDPAYRLGRLFAVLEKVQLEAFTKSTEKDKEKGSGAKHKPTINATIKDRYFAAASATPGRVFPLLVKTATHHLSNLRKDEKGGLAHHFEAEMGEIWSGLEADLPRSLNLQEQGRFIAGYYHQRWAKKDRPDTATEENQPEGASQ